MEDRSKARFEEVTEPEYAEFRKDKVLREIRTDHGPVVSCLYYDTAEELQAYVHYSHTTMKTTYIIRFS